MNWLDDYMAENETGYYVDTSGGYWVMVEEGVVRFAFGDRSQLDEEGTLDLSKVSRNDFVRKLIGGEYI